MSVLYVDAPNVSHAWLSATKRVLGEPGHKAHHTMVRIADPTAEVPAVRTAMDELLESVAKQSVDTVANTIFPATIADSSASHDELVERYERMYPTLQRYQPNKKGTYFHRLIRYPASKGAFDQIDAVITRIGKERDGGNPKQARYEITTGPDDDLAVNAPVYVPGRDNSPMAFPCLSHCSFQYRDGRVYLLAQYRYQYMVERGYGNYLGLGRLLAYVARQAGAEVGDLTVVAGLVKVDSPILQVRDMLDHFEGVGAL